MLVKLTKYQVSYYWPLIKQAVDGIDVPRNNPDMGKRRREVLRKLLIEELLCWVVVRDDGEGNSRISAFMITGTLTNELEGFKDHYIYILYTLPKEVIKIREWQENFETLKKYAKGIGCDRVTGGSYYKRVIDMAKVMGFDTNFTFVSYDLSQD